MECFYCEKMKKGHYARDCRKKKREESDDFHKNSSDNGAFVVTILRTLDNKENNKYLCNDSIKDIMNADTKDIWITDSGASCHMTYHRKWLTDFKSVIGEMVLLGDGKQCCVTGKGTI